MDSNLEWFQQWYAKQCNGDWEHTRGITLNTLDNPGWTLTVDLDQTPWANDQVERRLLERARMGQSHAVYPSSFGCFFVYKWIRLARWLCVPGTR